MKPLILPLPQRNKALIRTYLTSSQLLYRISLLLISLLISAILTAQTCTTIPTSPSAVITVPTSCSTTSSNIVKSGDVLELQLSLGRTYNFELCYNASYNNTSNNAPMLQLWTALGGTIADYETEAIGTLENCAKIEFTPCTAIDETVYLLPYSHLCLADWKAWDLNISCAECTFTPGADISIGASDGGCAAKEFTVATPIFEGPCENRLLSYTISPALSASPASPILLPATAITIAAGASTGIYTITWSMMDCEGNNYTRNQRIFIDAVLACNDVVQIPLNASGRVIVRPDMFLEGLSPACESNFAINITDENNTTYNDTLHCGLLGHMLFYEVLHIPSNTTCGGEIVIKDNLAPQLSCEDVTIACNINPITNITGIPVVNDNCDTDVTLSFEDDYVDFACANDDFVGSMNRVWTATDDYDNSRSCTQQIFIKKHTITEALFPVDTLIACHNANTEPINTGAPLLGDSSLVQPCNLLAYFEDEITHNCPGNYKIIRNWSILDWCTSTTQSHQQIIEVVDTTGPVLICPADFTVSTNFNSCEGRVSIPTITAIDDCSSNVSIGASWEFGTGISTYDNIPQGTHIVTYMATDDCGNMSTCTSQITIEDQIAPTAVCESFTEIVMPLKGSIEVCFDAFDSGSYDNCGLAKMEIARPNSNNFAECVLFHCTDMGGIIEVRLKVTDEEGLTNECTANLEITDLAAPIITCPNDVTLQCSQNPDNLDITGVPIVIDNCGVSFERFEEDLRNECGVGMLICTWIATDASGNSSFCEQTITMVDTTETIYTFATDTSLVCSPLTNDLGRPVIDADCRLHATGFDDLYIINEPCFQKIQRTWTSIDECNEEMRSESMIITVKNDTLAPEFLGVAADLTVSCDAFLPNFDPVIMDNCDDDLEIEMTEIQTQGSCIYEMTFVRMWVATDDCGNVSSFTQTINVVDDTPPLMENTPTDATIDCSEPIPNDAPIISDNCDPDFTTDFTETEVSGTCVFERIIIRAWTATDVCGNNAVHTQAITITDNQAPTFINIPQDTIINCTEIVPTDMPIASDNCSTNLTVDFQENMVDGTCSNETIITRTWTTSDECNNVASVMQVITLTDNTPPVITNIPPDTTIECGDFLPFVIPLASDDCGSDFSLINEADTIGTACDLQVIRTWIATDACGNSSSQQQIVTLEDTQAPIFTLLPSDEVLEISACSQFIAIDTPMAEDACGNNVNITTAIDFYSDNNIYTTNFVRNDTVFTGGNASGVYPLGLHTLTFTVMDDCGNKRLSQRTIQVTENVPPILTCNDFQFDLGIDTTITLTHSQLANSASDNCTDITYSFMNLPNEAIVNNDSLILGCPHIGINNYTLVATDAFGNSTTCENTISITDLNSYCGENSRPAYFISGQVYTENATPVAHIAMKMDSNKDNNEYTDTKGFYVFNEMEAGNTYTIQPLSSDDVLNGVSTYDLVLISQHVLGINTFDTPYKIIAADVNNDGKITTFDIVQLRQLILYVITELPSNTAWRFVDINYVFENPLNPLEENFPESQRCVNINSDQPRMDFVAVKIGDVSGDVSLQGETNSARHDRDHATIYTSNQLIEAGETYEIPFYSDDIKDLQSCQFSMDIARTDLKIKAVKTNGILNPSDIGQQMAERGILTLSWYPKTGVAETQLLFTLEVEAKKSGLLDNLIHINSSYTPIEAYNKRGALVDLELLFEAAGKSSKVDFVLHQNSPNPFQENTTIAFYLGKSAAVQFYLYDIAGKQIYYKQVNAHQGHNEINIHKQQFDQSGIYYYQLISPFGNATKKLILIK